MKKVVFFVSILISILCCTGCNPTNKAVLKYQKMEEGVENPTTEEELKAAIEKYQERVMDIQLANQEIGIWHKMLGTRYLDNKMYGEALKSFQKALDYYPDNQNLYYYVGVCAGYMSHTALDYNGTGYNEQKINYLKLAEEAYKRALEIDGRYERAWFGLGVIYEYELDEYEKACTCFEKALELSSQDYDTMFHLAASYYCCYEFDKAVKIYDKIINTSNSKDLMSKAQELKKQVLDVAYTN